VKEFTKAMAGILFTSAASERGMDYPDVAWATVGDGSWRMAMQLVIRSAISFLGLHRIRELPWIDTVFMFLLEEMWEQLQMLAWFRGMCK